MKTIRYQSENDFLQKGLISENTKNLIINFTELDSTNAFCKKYSKDIGKLDNTYIIAEQQTAGYGRLQRTWLAKKGESLTFTYVKKVDSPEHISFLPLATALSVHKTLQPYMTASSSLDIKWPNDILIGNNKVCGILIESFLSNNQQTFLIGIGVNTHTSQFAPEIQEIATSLHHHTQQTIAHTGLIENFHKHFNEIWNQTQTDHGKKLLEGYQKYSSFCNDKRISFIENNEKYYGTTKGLNESGALLCELKNGELKPLFISEINTVRENERD